MITSGLPQVRAIDRVRLTNKYRGLIFLSSLPRKEKFAEKCGDIAYQLSLLSPKKPHINLNSALFEAKH
jgi:hypothetical protein